MAADSSHQDWIPVVLAKKETVKGARTLLSPEQQRLYKLEARDPSEHPKKRVASDSLQELIRCRMERKLTQEKADQFCNFPKHTFKQLESHRALPTSLQQSVIQKKLGISLRVITIEPTPSQSV